MAEADSTSPAAPAPPSAGALRHLAAILILPGNVTITLPAVLVWRFGWDTLNLWQFHPYTQILLPVLALCAATGGLTLMVASIRLFAHQGRGTLAPWMPTQRLVVTGPYQYVRNPMISGVCGVLIAESLATANLYLAAWAAVFFLINVTYIPLVEEKGLRARFGDAYQTYTQNVPRWVPRLTPWAPGREESQQIS